MLTTAPCVQLQLVKLPGLQPKFTPSAEASEARQLASKDGLLSKAETSAESMSQGCGIGCSTLCHWDAGWQGMPWSRLSSYA